MKTLLIVDDEVEICTLLTRFFSSRGFRTQTAHSGHEALEKLKAETPDYLLLDIRMPDISGLDVLQAVKRQYPDVKVVMVTALGDHDTL